jgi:hypothetical protein
MASKIVKKKTKKRAKRQARKLAKRTAKLVGYVGRSAGPILAGVAAGLAAREVTGGGNKDNRLEDLGRDIAHMVRKFRNRAAETVGAGSARHPEGDEPTSEAPATH